KGWNAYVDGQLSPHICVNYVLRGMPVPAGQHKIEFKFEPAVYKTGNTISMAGSVLVIASVALGIYFEQKKKKEA
ncbi:MAG: YfhO family protein, partial [Bacteroidia bacterium]